MSEASEYIADLVEFGNRDYTDLSIGELEEIALLIYKEASNEDRKDMILDSLGSDDFFSLLFPFLDEVDERKADNFKRHSIKCLVEMTKRDVELQFSYEVDCLEENNRLRQQDSDYVELKECDL